MKILFIINVTRRDEQPDNNVIEQFRVLLENSGHDFRFVVSSSIEESKEAITEAIKEDFDALWIGGGDGTINSSLNMTYDTGMAYGIVPMGTVNALAKSLHLPLNPVEAVKYLIEATPVEADIGKVGETYFFLYATVGIHAVVFHNVDTRLKKRWGKLAFWESFIRTIWHKSRLPRFLMEMELINAVEGKAVVKDYGYAFTLTNVANYAGLDTFTDDDPATPGYFELHHFRRNRILPMLAWIANLRIWGTEKSKPKRGQVFRCIRWVKIRSNHKLSVQVDGEPIKPRNRKEMKFECLENAVHILLRPAEARKLRGNNGET